MFPVVNNEHVNCVTGNCVIDSKKPHPYILTLPNLLKSVETQVW